MYFIVVCDMTVYNHKVNETSFRILFCVILKRKGKEQSDIALESLSFVVVSFCYIKRKNAKQQHMRTISLPSRIDYYWKNVIAFPMRPYKYELKQVAIYFAFKTWLEDDTSLNHLNECKVLNSYLYWLNIRSINVNINVL